ncbi:PRTRC system protein E [Duganella aceris]|uniref:PRTRC system protein E n=1 Tax=Duganella aceris TaxID=2703883 RepID=A0ABX0FPH6_9BURK|nr:PRTRC system protein E [Duganella aceris]NGZ86435.1 PRTRC system protein E [Duganella aceris]
MFNALKALAQNATLMLVVAGEDDGQLRVSITPTYPGDKPKAHALKPLVLTGTADELDADFAAAIGIWHAPKRSLIEQAQAAADTNDDDDEEEVEGKSSTNGKPRSAANKSKEDKAPRKPRNAPAPISSPPSSPPSPAHDAAAPAPAPTPAPAPVVDTVTLNLF